MKIIQEIGLTEFEPWSGGVATKARIIEEGLETEFDSLIEELYEDGIDETTLNDLLWFESEWIYESLGIDIA